MPTEMFTKEFLVKESQTAKMLGSGDLEVLGTPALAAMIEQTAKEAVKDQLSVGNNCRNGVRIAPLISIRGRGDNRCYDDRH